MARITGGTRYFPDKGRRFMVQSQTPFTASLTTHVSPWRDVVIVLAITLGAASLAAHYELNEAVFALTRRWEGVQLDEWPIAVFVLALCLVWLSWRRYIQALTQLRARQAAEAKLAEALAENRLLAHQHLLIQEAERKHLARELHDELGQYLNAIKLDAVAMGESSSPGGGDSGSAPANPASERIVRAVDHVHGVVSDMIRRLRPAGLDELGLVAALENCVDHWRQRLPDTRFSLSAGGNLEDLGELTNLTLYRLIQEGLTNSYKHAGAGRIDIELRRGAVNGDDELVLTVRDNGQGMNPHERKPGFGLSGMRERVELMGGQFAIDSAPGRGFSFEARLPSSARE
jgi:signal transduction histidine kinase